LLSHNNFEQVWSTAVDQGRMGRVAAVEVLGGRYRLVERLGMGGMSVVWRAYDEVLGRQVAVKVLAAKFAADQDSRDRIRAEAQAAARLSHPHVTGVYDYGESTADDGATVPYVVMELISGRTLAERLARGPMPWRAALRVGAEVAAALAAAHARGLVHRDVKPANVMLTPAGAKVVDFGIAAIAGESGEPGPDGMLLGTPAYLAPERLAGGPVRPATDVYALGLLLYRSLTGGLPWKAETTTQMITAHVYVEPAPLPALDGVPEGVSDLCLRCLAKNPADRPTSREVARTLAAAAGIRVPLTAADDEPDDLVLDPTPAPFVARPAGRGPGRLRTAVAALFGTSVDPAAETAILPNSVIDGAGTRNAQRRRRRRVLQIAALVGSMGAAAFALTMCGNLDGSEETPAAAAGDRVGGPSQAPCNVRYLTRSDGGGQFKVDLKVTNNTARAVTGWALQFPFTGDQTLREGSAGDWSQSREGLVTVREQGTVAAQGSANLSFTAGYNTANPFPTRFTLNGVECSYLLVGATGLTQSGGPGVGPTPLVAVGGASGGPAAPAAPLGTGKAAPGTNSTPTLGGVDLTPGGGPPTPLPQATGSRSPTGKPRPSRSPKVSPTPSPTVMATLASCDPSACP